MLDDDMGMRRLRHELVKERIDNDANRQCGDGRGFERLGDHESHAFLLIDIRRIIAAASNRVRATAFKRYYRVMRGAWRLLKRRLFPAAFALAGAALSPALAGQSAVDLDLLPGLPPPADSGKPAIVPPVAAAPEQNDTGSCQPPLPCGARLLGAVRKNGAVELQVPVLRW